MQFLTRTTMMCEKILLCPEIKSEGQNKTEPWKNCFTSSQQVLTPILLFLICLFFLPADVKAHTQREKDHSEVTNILVCVWTREAHSVWAVCALQLGFYINREICTKFILHDVSSSNILYRFLSLTFSSTHDPCTAEICKQSYSKARTWQCSSGYSEGITMWSRKLATGPQITTLTGILFCYEVRQSFVCSTAFSASWEARSLG